MTLHFAYGSNMSRAVMGRHAPGAEPVGVASLANHRFLIATHGHASVAPMVGKTVHGVLWRLTVRDCVTLAAWENVASGLYRAQTIPVRHAGRRRAAVVYLACSERAAAPQAGYMELVIAAALEWHLPKLYIDELKGWLPRHPHKRKEFRWT